MDDVDDERGLQAEAILQKVVVDFEQLDRTIELAISLLEQADRDTSDEIAALRRARDAARKGAGLAKSKVSSV